MPRNLGNELQNYRLGILGENRMEIGKFLIIFRRLKKNLRNRLKAARLCPIQIVWRNAFRKHIFASIYDSFKHFLKFLLVSYE